MTLLSPELWIIAACVALGAGVVKGVTGFGMPMLMISGLGSFLAPDLAIAALILPALATNTWQALRTGLADAVGSARAHWRFLLVLGVMIVISAQLVGVLSQTALFLIIGGPVTLFAALQLLGWRMRFPPSARRKVEIAVAAISGFIGGLSGVWGPPTVAYLTALGTPKREHVRVQGVVYATGSILLAGAHIRSGVFNLETAPVSAILCIPAIAGLLVGFRIQDRLDQELFRKATLIVLILAGLNLVRRALTV